ncbi:MAG TPA: hypothetical protein VGD66_06990 [Allosphingosinicella sp.]
MRNRGSRRRRRITGARVARWLICAAAALFAGWWVVRMAAVDALVRQNPFLAAAIAPEHPRVKIALAMTEFTLRNGHVGRAARAGVGDALRRSALSDEPFVLGAVYAIAGGEGARGDRLLEEARRRNPRSRLTRLLLVDRYLRENRADAAGTEIGVLRRLLPQADQVLIPELARMARAPETSASMKRILARDAVVRNSVLAHLAATGADTGLILGIAAAAPSGSAPADWQRVLIGRLAGEGHVADAYRLWLRFGGRGAAGAKGIYDPGFAGLPGGPPFNWELVTGGEGVAERTPGGALQVDYYGRAPVTLARQIMMLAPGAYRLAFHAEGDAKGDGSRLTWNVTCLGAAGRLLQLPLTGIASGPRTLAAGFTVPPGCAAQWLSLDGSAGDVATEQAVTLSSLQLTGGRTR